MSLYAFLARAYVDENKVASHVKNQNCIAVAGLGDAPQHACTVWLEPNEGNDSQLLLKLMRVPTNDDLLSLVEEIGGKHRGEGERTDISLIITLKASPKVNALARGVRQLVGRGQTYADGNWRWICPKTADALVELGQYLREYRSQF